MLLAVHRAAPRLTRCARASLPLSDAICAPPASRRATAIACTASPSRACRSASPPPRRAADRRVAPPLPGQELRRRAARGGQTHRGGHRRRPPLPRHVGRRHVPDAARPTQARDGAGERVRKHAHAPRARRRADQRVGRRHRRRHDDGDALRRQGVAPRRRRRRRQVVFEGARLRRLAPPLLGLPTFKLLAADRGAPAAPAGSPISRRSCSSATPASSRSTRGASRRRCRRCRWTASGPTSS